MANMNWKDYLGHNDKKEDKVESKKSNYKSYDKYVDSLYSQLVNTHKKKFLDDTPTKKSSDDEFWKWKTTASTTPIIIDNSSSTPAFLDDVFNTPTTLSAVVGNNEGEYDSDEDFIEEDADGFYHPPTYYEEPKHTNISHFRSLYRTIKNMYTLNPDYVFSGNLSLFLLGLSNRIPHDIDICTKGDVPISSMIQGSHNIKVHPNDPIYKNWNYISSQQNRVYVKIDDHSSYYSQGVNYVGTKYVGIVGTFNANPFDYNTLVSWYEFPNNIPYNDIDDLNLSTYLVKSNCYAYNDLEYLDYNPLLNSMGFNTKNNSFKKVNDVEYTHYKNNNYENEIDIFKFTELPFTPINYKLGDMNIKLADPKWIIDAKLYYVTNCNKDKVYGNYEEHINKHMQDIEAVAQIVGYDEKIKWREDKECNADGVQQPAFSF